MTANRFSFRTSSRAFRAFTIIEVLIVVIVISVLIALVLPGIMSSRENTRRYQCTYNISRLGLAARDYEESRGFLPTGSTASPGPVRNVPVGDAMGWLPRILPELQLSGLYNLIDFSQSVYSPANQPAWLASTLSTSSILFCPSDPGCFFQPLPVNISYVGCHGNVETAINSDNNGTFVLNEKIRTSDFPDGTAHTILFGESVIFHMPGHETALRTQNDHRGNKLKGNKFTIQWPQDANELCHPFVLGWMSGTGATLRNTANAINVITGPFAADNRFSNLVTENRPFAWEDNGKPHSPKTFVIPTDWWAKPRPLEYLVGGFSSYHPYGANFFMADGSVRYVSANIDMTVYRKLGSRLLSTADNK